MVNVTIRRLRTGLTGVSGLALLGGTGTELGCSAPSGEAVGTAATADTSPIAPGSGTLSLSGGWGGPTTSFSFTAEGSTDEFVRVGETMAINLPAWDLWHPVSTDPNVFPTTQYLQQLQATVTVQFIRSGEVIGTASVHVESWTGESNYDLVAQTGTFVIPQACDTLAFDVIIVDPGNDDHRVELASLDFTPVPVFGAEYPLKHAIFDNYYSALRQRIIEGGALVGGSEVVITYSDWRADEIVNKTGLNLEIGTAQSYGRFGPITVPIFGQLVYEISAGESFDGAHFGEVALPATTSSRVLDAPGRTAYESTLYVQQGASQMDLYFHVKAYLVANYAPYGSSVTNRLYLDGQRVLLAEKYDNPNGSFTNYVLPVSSPPATP